MCKRLEVCEISAMESFEAASTEAAEKTVTPRGTLFVYSPDGHGYAHRHEKDTRTEIAKKLAALKSLDFAGEYDPALRPPGPVYFVPSDTLVGVKAAHELGIHSAHGLFGGVAPHPFVATKAITHPLIEPDAAAPAGWSHEFGHRVRDAVLSGFSVFTADDARRAAARLFEQGPVRVKPVRATGGRGQSVVSEAAELDALLDAIAPADLSTYGLVLEENLSHVTTYSVGQVRVADLVATYYGTQRLTPDNAGAMVYGGSDLMIVRGDIDRLLEYDLPDQARLAVAQARRYDEAAMECFSGLFASRRNYDIAQGLNSSGRLRSGVLEQSWRIGGASGAEIAALEAFRAAPALHGLRASCVEIYGESDMPPPNATLYFRDLDEQVGFITKYTLVEADGDAG